MPHPPCSVRYALAVLAAVPVVLLGPQEQTTAAPVPAHLMKPRFSHPTAVGTKWVYERGGNEETFLITRAEEQNGAKVITIETVNADGKTTPYWKLAVTAQEWCLTEETGASYDPPWCMLKLPHAEGCKWEFATSRKDLGGPIVGAAVQAAKMERLKVPAGTFDAIKVETSFTIGIGKNEVQTTYWYASGVGLVQMDDPPYRALKSFKIGTE